MTPFPALNRSRRRAETVDPEAAKTLVLAEIDRLVAVGHAAIVRSEGGALSLRFTTGEVFQLGEEAVTRIA